MSQQEMSVRHAVRTNLSDLAGSDELVLIACSGGPDSVSLAAATAFVALRTNIHAGAVVVDHGLQQGSAEVAATTAAWLREQGLHPVEVVSITVSEEGGPEAAARTARYAALDATAQNHGATAILLGHTQDDQAETVLLGLARGSGARSLAGMAARRGLLRRPLLELSREVVRAAVPRDAPVWRDPHNVDPAYARARVRRDVLPVMEASLGPGIAAALSRSASLLRADADALDALAQEAFIAVVVRDESAEVALPVGALAVMSAAVRSRVLRLAATAAGAPAGTVTHDHVRAMMAFIDNWHGQGPTSLPGGVDVSRSCGRLTLRRRTWAEPSPTDTSET